MNRSSYCQLSVQWRPRMRRRWLRNLSSLERSKFQKGHNRQSRRPPSRDQWLRKYVHCVTLPNQLFLLRNNSSRIVNLRMKINILFNLLCYILTCHNMNFRVWNGNSLLQIKPLQVINHFPQLILKKKFTSLGKKLR